MAYYDIKMEVGENTGRRRRSGTTAT